MDYKIVTYFLLIGLITFLSCSENKVEEVLLSYKCEQCPQIKENQDTLFFINEVHAFVAANADKGVLYNSLCDTFYNVPIKRFDVDTFLNIFNEDKGVATCGLSALLMVKILTENGINAYTYNFGFEETKFTHVVVLVEYGKKILFFDPYINYTILNSKDSSEVDFIEMIVSIKKNDFEPIYYSDSVKAEMLIDFSKIDTSRSTSKECSDWGRDIELIKDNVYKKNIYVCYECNRQNPCSSFVLGFEAELKKQTEYTKFHEGFLFKINEVYGGEGSQALNLKIDSILAL